MKTAGGRTVTGHAHRADRLLIRPASGRQAGTGLSARTNHWKDTRERGHPLTESRAKSTGTNLTTAPDGATTHSQSSHSNWLIFGRTRTWRLGVIPLLRSTMRLRESPSAGSFARRAGPGSARA